MKDQTHLNRININEIHLVANDTFCNYFALYILYMDCK